MPAGFVDVPYVTRVCSSALKGMKWACKQVERRVKGWQGFVVDVLVPIREAMRCWAMRTRLGITS